MTFWKTGRTLLSIFYFLWWASPVMPFHNSGKRLATTENICSSLPYSHFFHFTSATFIFVIWSLFHGQTIKSKCFLMWWLFLWAGLRLSLLFRLVSTIWIGRIPGYPKSAKVYTRFTFCISLWLSRSAITSVSGTGALPPSTGRFVFSRWQAA